MTAGLSLVVSTGSRANAIPLAAVVEIMRALPVESLADMPPFVLGLSIIRGGPTPVVHLGRLVGGDEGDAHRFVSLRLGDRKLALAVASVLGVMQLEPGELTQLPPILGPASADVVEAVGELDSQLLLLLRETRMVPDSVYSALSRREPR